MKLNKESQLLINEELDNMVRKCFYLCYISDIKNAERIPVERISRLIPGFDARIYKYSQRKTTDESLELEGLEKFKLKSEKAAWVEYQNDNKKINEIWIRSEDTNAARRFSIAHEIGHYFIEKNYEILGKINNYIEESKDKKEIIEKMADRFAGKLLLPNDMIKNQFKIETAEKEGLEYIEDYARKCSVGLQMLAIRINEVFKPGPENWFFLTADIAIAKSKKSTLALRVKTRVSPKGYYFPNNSRLSSIGLDDVSKKYNDMMPFYEENCKGKIKVEIIGKWRKVALEYIGNMRKYQVNEEYSYLALFGRINIS